MEKLIHLLNQYRSKTDQEHQKATKQTMLSFLTSEGIKSFHRESIQAHFTASAWIVNLHSKEVIMLHHKKLNKWLQPGGHADGETDLQIVAKKEAHEETGLNHLNLATENIFDLDIHEIPEHKGIPKHEHYDVRFAYFCKNKEAIKINEESTDFKWIKLSNIRDLTSEESILRMAKKTESIINE
jgi:8-oxo-dGTP pyrophosphatase MutT (NUDIX family)